MTGTNRTGIFLPRKANHMFVPRRLSSAASLLFAVAVLAGCGSSSDSTGSESTTPTTRPSGEPSGAAGPQAEQFAKIQECLTAAGITVDVPSGLPSRPTGTARPDPSGPPRSGAPGGGLGGVFNDQEAQAALKACGISLPTGRPSGR